MSQYIQKAEQIDTQFSTLQNMQSITCVEEIVENYNNYEKKSTEMYSRLNIIENEIDDIELQIKQKSRQIIDIMARINVSKEQNDEEINLKEQDHRAILKVQEKLKDNITDSENHIEKLRDSAKDIYA